ncbi:MAG: Coenzyme F420 hydrogenase/dehydrogenase, beta subunit C-terminal domain [Lacisediminihabitans sp.]
MAAGGDVVATFEACCPGVQVSAQNPPGTTRHPTMGPIIQVFEAWSTDDRIRFEGSSGGVLTALTSWLVDTGEAARVVGAAGDPAEPRRSISVQLTTKEDTLSSAGSRYAPVSNAAQSGALLPDTAFVGKPCEVSALRALHAQSDKAPLLLSFYCAGTPSQRATDALTESLGVSAAERIRNLWYRGHGWPGRFTVTRDDDSTVSASYDESWGNTLGPAVQWRCKLCADGVGESADITAADLWRADDRGYPDFSEESGVSALIARTARGLDVVRRAVAAGVIEATPIEITALAAVQPLHRERRSTLLGRLFGTVLAGGAVPRYRGFGLLALALPRLRANWRTAKGSYRRRRALRGLDE